MGATTLYALSQRNQAQKNEAAVQRRRCKRAKKATDAANASAQAAQIAETQQEQDAKKRHGRGE